MRSPEEWTSVAGLVERVVGEEDLLPSVVAGVRTMVREVAALPTADMTGHTRALLFAATRALADRRGPSEAELTFVEDLAVTRARQGVPIEAVLRAIHVAERAIWARARETAPAAGVAPDLLLDARELYDDWAEAVRSRLITAHRAARAGRDPGAGERDAAILRRLLEGGSAAALAAAEAGLPTAGGLWALAARADDPNAAAALERALREQPPALCAGIDGLLAAVLARPPAPRAGRAGTTAGLAGPAEPEELPAAWRLALDALAAAESSGRTGVVHVAEVPALVALAGRPDLAAVLADRHRPAWHALGANAVPVALAVSAWLEADRDVGAAAERLFVHPNTVRNRVQRFTDVTGVDPATTFGAVDAWWLCGTWLSQA
ncbi:helix-turn-helix domain-containing protein [Actinocorallia populi]|uniref:helix-turn-helix domain-containing protein n=1 Tax=Actinocorallia populi TaxID=2079200 RepID=UPI000D09562A|nr:helix-turn-helix domain-containing protein [Actinocorallia populi]